MTRVYFEQGGAMYLSFDAASKFLAAKNLLAERIDGKAKPSDMNLRDTFSAFRTQLKIDLLIYTEKEAQTPLQT